MSLDHLSFATTPVVALRGDTPLWQGSGFFYMVRGEDSGYMYLVTNLHVLTGSGPGASDDDSQADHIVFQFHLSKDEPSEVKPVRVPLFTRQGRPVWVENEQVPGADLAAILIPGGLCNDTAVACLDASAAKTGNAALEPLSTIHAVGFPYGCHDKENALPLWQTGTLASEPDVDFDGEPCLAANLPAYPGLSGAPVFAITQYRPPAAGAAVAQPVTMRRFIGLYASPVMPDGSGYPEMLCAQAPPALVARDAGSLGRVWRAGIIEDMLSGVDTGRWQREILADLG